MHVNRQELFGGFDGVCRAANRRVRRARRTSGRLLASAFGFGVAYYFDTVNGEARRRKAQRWLGRTARRLDSVFDAEAGNPPPVVSPLLRGRAVHDRAGGPAGSAVRQPGRCATSFHPS
jgi:hypothetical protein